MPKGPLMYAYSSQYGSIMSTWLYNFKELTKLSVRTITFSLQYTNLVSGLRLRVRALFFSSTLSKLESVLRTWGWLVG
ncbi:hypothetical protein R1flu_009752 [Riccia fluitans]|uniref:Uncharacterized protein n=1 Tax=Riccia fluitans TaxID=41844 RepID=A0ABD1Z315_9MARC